MHIVHVLYDNPFNPWLGGGAAKRAQAIEKYLVKQGHSITYVSGGFPGCKKLIPPEGVKYVFTPCSGKYALSRLLFPLCAGFAVKKTVAAAKAASKVSSNTANVLLVEDVSIFNLFFPRLFYNGKMVSLIHNYIGKQCFKKLGVFGAIPYFLERHIFKTRQNYIAVSNALKQNVLQFNSKANVEVIFNGIDNAVFNTEKNINCTPNSNPINKTIGFIGRLEINQKGLDILVAALKILFASREYRAIFIGGGKDEAELRKLVADAGISDRVEITGRMGEERFKRLAACDVVCMPSRFEGWGITAIEAAALGIPVVGSNIDGLNEAVVNGKTGVLLDTVNGEVDAAELAKQIGKLLDDYMRYAKISQQAKLHAQKFNWADIAAKQLAFYEQV